MQKRRHPLLIALAGLVVAALLLTDMLPVVAQARAAGSLAAPAEVSVAAAGERIEVAQNRPRKKRKTLMDLLFGDEEEVREEVPVIEKPVVRKKKSKSAKQAKPAAPPPPPKPEVIKAEGATRVAVFGDSMAADLGKALERFYEKDPNIVVLVEGQGASGLVRPDFFDWPGTIRKMIAENSFDIAVIFVGINDRQSISIDGVSHRSLSPEWLAEYATRTADIAQQLRSANKPTVWVGLPPMQAPKFGQTMIQINEMQRLAAFGSGAEFLDIYERFLSEEGKYTTHGPDLNGKRVRMRRDDGIHFSTAGVDKLAFYLGQSLKNYYRGGGTVGIEIADPLLGTDAQAMLRPPYQGLGQIRLLEVAGAVISLNQTPTRAADLLSADKLELTPTAFDMTMLIEAPVGRADAFGVGRKPGSGVENPAGR